MSNKKYHGLTNEELLLLYELIKDKKSYFTKSIEEKELLFITKEGTLAKILLSDKDIIYIKDQEWFTLVHSIFNKLDKILPLLLEVEDYKNLYEKIRT